MLNWSPSNDNRLADDAVRFGREVIATEMEGLAKLAESLDDQFSAAIDLILENKGRVILSGMGKSGHVANKVTATLASTGTPAFFVHLSEAAHGDLGMITKNDIVLIFSNSGETDEIIPVIRYCKRLGVPLLAVSANKDSLLMRAADVKILLPKAKEACAVGMAPTTSTMMMLCLGDALSVALMRKRGFTKPNFLDLHPGGKLGLMLTPARDFMIGKEALPLAACTTQMEEVILEITSKSLGIAGIVNDAGQLVGTITDGDLRRNMKNIWAAPARDVMNDAPVIAHPSALIEDIANLMRQHKVSAVFICDNGIPVGLIHMHHLLAVRMAV